jgi:hypothetical protein
MESIEGKPTEIISIPWKSANAQAGEESKAAGSPANITLDLASAQELDANLVSIPVSWKRLQFKHATANNGRRKGLQQHYVVQISLLGKTSSGEIIKIAEVQSGPVIVRGRSPRNFDSRKDVPLTSEKKLERKNTSGSDNATLKAERDTLQANVAQYQQSTPTVPVSQSSPDYAFLTNAYDSLMSGLRLSHILKLSLAQALILRNEPQFHLAFSNLPFQHGPRRPSSPRNHWVATRLRKIRCLGKARHCRLICHYLRTNGAPTVPVPSCKAPSWGSPYQSAG